MDDEDIDGNTVAAYLDIFKRLFITDNQPPFSSGIRSSVTGEAGGESGTLPTPPWPVPC